MVTRALLLPVLLLSTVLLRAQAPTVQDCLGAIPVCEATYYTTNSYTGHGNVYPEIHNTGVCPLCMDGEKNDVFYIITVQTSGILRFTLTPNNPSNDYDWSLFNMTNAECDQIYTNASSLQVSCNSYGVLAGSNGPTGINTALGNQQNCNGPGVGFGPPFNKDLTVFSGETYVLNISNWSSSNQSGYTLDFSASTASIYDNVPPVIDSIQESILCSGSTELFLHFSENVVCDDLFQHPEKLTLTGPEGSYIITDIGSTGCATGANQSPSFTLYLNPPVHAGDYILSVAGDIHDLCGNLAVYQGYPFTLTETNAPWAGAGNDTTVANGAIITLHGSAGAGAGGYTWYWEPSALLVNPDVQNPVTVNMGASTEFVLTVTDNAGCEDSDEVLVSVVGGPLGVSAQANPATICNTGSTTLGAIASGGSGIYTYTWTSGPPGFSSGLPNPVVSPGVTTTYYLTVADGFSTASSQVTVTVHPLPVAHAGSDFSIPYGTSAILSGSATGGSGNYLFQWSSDPPGYSGTIPSPTFYNLQQTTLFNLAATDANTGCLSAPDAVIVTVTGSPLACNPVAMPPLLCLGASSQLVSMAGGGSGTYTWQWTSDPPGFTSTLASPVVSPQVSTGYHLVVGDGYNNAEGFVEVHVDPVPVIHLGPPDTTICVYDTLLLDAGNEGSQYLWSNGSTERTLMVTTTGIGYDQQEYSVRVTNSQSCSDSASILVIFTFDACTAIGEYPSKAGCILSPNPSNGRFSLVSPVPLRDATLSVLDPQGREVFREDVGNPKSDIFVVSFNLTGFPAGVYLVRLVSHDFTGVVRGLITK